MSVCTFFGRRECYGVFAGRKTKASVPLAQKLLGFQIIFVEEGRVKEFRDTDTESLTYFMDYTEFYGIVGAVNQIADGRFRHSAPHIQLIVGHAPRFQQFSYSFADGFIQLHSLHHTSL